MKVYVLSPYTGRHNEMEWRFTVATKYAAALMQTGVIAVSPITHCHLIAKLGNLDVTYDYWKRWNASLIEWSDMGHLLCLPGWTQSVGVKGELKEFEAQGKPVLYIDHEQYHEAIGGLA